LQQSKLWLRLISSNKHKNKHKDIAKKNRHKNKRQPQNKHELKHKDTAIKQQSNNIDNGKNDNTTVSFDRTLQQGQKQTATSIRVATNFTEHVQHTGMTRSCSLGTRALLSLRKPSQQ
jgi:hypothetical protein